MARQGSQRASVRHGGSAEGGRGGERRCVLYCPARGCGTAGATTIAAASPHSPTGRTSAKPPVGTLGLIAATTVDSPRGAVRSGGPSHSGARQPRVGARQGKGELDAGADHTAIPACFFLSRLS